VRQKQYNFVGHFAIKVKVKSKLNVFLTVHHELTIHYLPT